MKILIIDTSNTPSWVVWVDHQEQGSTLLDQTTLEGCTLLVSTIAHQVKSDVPDVIALGIGPGTFTGTRIGGMTAKTLSFAWNIPLIPFSSLLIPDFTKIASIVHNDLMLNKTKQQVQLVYISPSP